MTKILALIVLVLCACSPEPPATYAIDAAFSAAEAEVIRDVARAWCESERAFCTTEAAWGTADAQVHLDRHYQAQGRPRGSFAFTDRWEPAVYVDANHPLKEDLHVFWRGLAHEWGHLSGLDGHGHGLDLMAAEPDPWGPLAIE